MANFDNVEGAPPSVAAPVVARFDNVEGAPPSVAAPVVTGKLGVPVVPATVAGGPDIVAPAAGLAVSIWGITQAVVPTAAPAEIRPSTARLEILVCAVSARPTASGGPTGLCWSSSLDIRLPPSIGRASADTPSRTRVATPVSPVLTV